MAQDPNSAMEAWFQLMAQAMQSTQEAQKAFSNMPRSPEAMADFQRWLALFAPGMDIPVSVSQPEAMVEWLETWQKAMGVVPRSRYLELLEKADALERRVRELEEVNRQLRAILEGGQQQVETAQRISDFWGQMVENSYKTQAAWMEAWTGNETPGKVAASAAGNLDEEE